MELHVFFDKPVAGQFGGVVLKAMRKYGTDEDKINALSIQERLELLAEKTESDAFWSDWIQKSRFSHQPLRYQDLPFLPDGIFYDCGLERISFGADASALHVAAEDDIGADAEKPEPNSETVGVWEHIELIDGHAMGECSHCHKVRIIDNFCPNCGKKMEVGNS